MTVNVVYLHGFASSPGSRKAGWFGQHLRSLRVNYVVPDLNVPSFERLTLTAMIDRTADVVRDLPDGPVYLIGSSLGGLTALHFLDRKAEAARIERALLLAPALDFMENRDRQLGEHGMAQWRERGTLPVTHYADGGTYDVHYGLVEDIQQYDSYQVKVGTPLLIVHGVQDESVDYTQSIRFATGRGSVTLRLPDADHGLMGEIDMIWQAMTEFFGLSR